MTPHLLSDAKEEYGLGRLPQPDDRDRKFLMRTILRFTRRDREDRRRPWRYYRTGRVLDQGSTPQCVGYSWRQFLSSAPIMTKEGPAAVNIYRAAQKVDEWPGENYDGTSVRAGVKVLSSLGRITGYVWAWDVETMVDWILQDQGTVVVGTNWYSSMYNVDDDDFININGRVVGGHAYLVVGCNERDEKFRILNSWGRSWGDEGRAWIRFNDMQRLIDEDGEACAAVEQPLESLGI